MYWRPLIRVLIRATNPDQMVEVLGRSGISGTLGHHRFRNHIHEVSLNREFETIQLFDNICVRTLLQAPNHVVSVSNYSINI